MKNAANSPKSGELAPSQVREIIRGEHKQLGALLDEMEQLIGKKDHSRLNGCLVNFNEMFLKHIAQEEKILLPALKDLDSWGDVRVSNMRKEHVDQRKRIADLADGISKKADDSTLKQLKDFIAEFRTEMATEEKECLHPDVMKDDPITVAGISG